MWLDSKLELAMDALRTPVGDRNKRAIRGEEEEWHFVDY